MDYQKIDMKKFNLHMIKTDRFKTINVRINFKRKIKKEEINYRNFLSEILLESSNIYKTRRDLQIKKEELYNTSLSSVSYKSGCYTFLSYSLTFLNEKYTEVGMNEESIKLLLEMLLNPNVENGAFNQKSFDLVKEEIKTSLISMNENPDIVASLKLDELMGKDTPLEYKMAGYLDTIDEVTSENLYEYYKSVISDDIIDIFIIGDIGDEIKDYFENIDFRDTENKKSESHFVKLSLNEEQEVIENKGFVQSKLQMGFKIEELTEFERKYVLHAYSFILGGGNDSKLFREVREENSLCYYISSNYSPLFNTLNVTAGIGADDYETAVELVKKAIKEMEDGEFSDSDLEEVKTIYQNACMKLYDSPASIIQNYLSHEYLNNDLIDERIEKIKEVTKDDIVKLAKKIKLDTIYFLEGGNDLEEE